MQDPHIRCAIVFGHQQLELGVLIEAAPGFEIPPGDVEALANFKQTIWLVKNISHRRFVLTILQAYDREHQQDGCVLCEDTS